MKSSKINKLTGLPLSFDDTFLFTVEEEKITSILIKKLRKRKFLTILKGYITEDTSLILKKRLGCNGFKEGDFFSLQGNHIHKIKGLLSDLKLVNEDLEIKYNI